MNDSEHLNKRERAERGLEDLREMLVEMITDGGKIHPGIDAEIDVAHALEGLDRAEDALRKWTERDIDGEWRRDSESPTSDELAQRSRSLANTCVDIINELESNDEYSAGAHMGAAAGVLRDVVAHPHVEGDQSIVRLSMVLDALERAREEVADAEVEESIGSLLTDIRELCGDLE